MIISHFNNGYIPEKEESECDALRYFVGPQTGNASCQQSSTWAGGRT